MAYSEGMTIKHILVMECYVHIGGWEGERGGEVG